LRRRDDLAVVRALAGDPRRSEHPPKRLRRPAATRRGGDRSRVQVAGDRAQRLAGAEASRALPHDRGLGRAELALVGLVAVGAAATAGDLAAQGQLLMLAADPLALVVALV